MKKLIAVKDIATFLYSSGDLTNDLFSNKSLKDGKDAHNFLQHQYNDKSEKEYYIKLNYNYKDNEFTIHGFIDGVLNEDDKTILQEIKSTKEDLEKIDLNYHKEHLAQLLLYAYIYADLYQLKEVNLRLTYIHIPDYEIKDFNLTKSFEELEEFFKESIEKYFDWQLLLLDNDNVKLDSIKNIEFPFKEKREGQYELMKSTYYTLTHNEILYAIAPTGIGKTMATLFPALKSLMKENEKLFYLTAKTTGRTVVIDSVKLLLKKGLKLKSIVISSKLKSCLSENKKVCDPDKCPYAKGYFNRLRDAIEDIYKNEDLFDEKTIKKYAVKHQICAFEFSLDLSYFCDLVICDYNYVFDPKAHLVRYFEEDTYKIKVLLDEAHNLIDRSKSMFSASFISDDLYELVEILAKYDNKLYGYSKKVYNRLKEYDELLSEELFYYSHEYDEELLNYLWVIQRLAEKILNDNKEFDRRNDAIEKYFLLKDLLDTTYYFNSDYLYIVKKEDEKYIIELSCNDASSYILDRIEQSISGIVFFSATMYPIKYHMDLLTQSKGKYVSLKSPFDKKKMKLIIKDNVSTKYKDRENSVKDIIEVINALVSSKKGNYIVFFPSYKYIELVLKELSLPDYEILIQDKDMNEEGRNNYINKFKDENKNHLGLFVMGGSFSEAIDYKNDLLSGVIIVGVGLPQVNIENNLLKEFMEEKYEDGFDYAYTYPGFNKVLQAAGRVIRTKDDVGVVILIDERYRYFKYQSLMPEYWSHKIYMKSNLNIKLELENFWRENNE